MPSRASGIYVIRNTVNGKVYVGSSHYMHDRWKAHIACLKTGKHHSRKLQNSWNKHGAESFEFLVVLLCEQKDLMMYEQQVMDFYDAYRKGYNGVPLARSRQGSKHHKDVLQRMKAFQRSSRKKYEWKGQQICLAEIAEMEGVPRDLLIRRIADGWPIADAVAKKAMKANRLFSAYGKTRTLSEWAEILCVPKANMVLWKRTSDTFEDAIGKAKQWTVCELGTSLGADGNTFSARIKLGWSAGDAAAKPVFKGKLNQDSAREIFDSQDSKKDLAKRYGIHLSMVYLIKTGKSWANTMRKAA